MRLAELRYLFVFIALFLMLGVQPLRAADAPFVVTLPTVVDTMLKMGRVNADDYLIDLGSGDGRIVIAAAKQHRARGYGVELDPNLVLTARREAQRQGVADRVTFEAENLFNIDIGKASIITMYIGESVNMRLRPTLLKLKPGTRIVSHDFDLGNWTPDEKVTIPVPNKPYGPPRSDIMLWVVPADFSGVWQWTVPGADGEVRYESRIEQRFQIPELVLTTQGLRLAVNEARISGNTLSFVINGPAGPQRYSGELSGNRISGQAVRGNGQGVTWQATRIKTGKRDIGTGGATPVAVGN